MTAELATHQLDNLQADLHALREQRISNHAFSAAARGHAVLLAALPPRYGEVLLSLIDRLEASALFTEESCSFSRSSLLDHLQVWVDKARSALPGA